MSHALHPLATEAPLGPRGDLAVADGTRRHATGICLQERVITGVTIQMALTDHLPEPGMPTGATGCTTSGPMLPFTEGTWMWVWSPTGFRFRKGTHASFSSSLRGRFHFPSANGLVQLVFTGTPFTPERQNTVLGWNLALLGQRLFGLCVVSKAWQATGVAGNIDCPVTGLQAKTIMTPKAMEPPFTPLGEHTIHWHALLTLWEVITSGKLLLMSLAFMGLMVMVDLITTARTARRAQGFS